MHSNTTSPKSSPDSNQIDSGDDDIVAIATPPGRGGVSVVRLSGPNALEISIQITGQSLTPRLATYSAFTDSQNAVIDHGLAIYFPAPYSYTGEHVLELQGHGSPIVMQMLVKRCLELGARLARPGEFSERAFLNNRMDLAQAEAVADLIESSTEAAARSALRSLQGEFSNHVQGLVQELTELRIYIEAAIDFPDEEIDFLGDGQVMSRMLALKEKFDCLAVSANRGKILRDGLRVVLTGPPNAGKSSLLNALSEQQRAIVSDIPGTTRDVLEQQIAIDGLPIELVDTAGIRQSGDEIESEGVRRAFAEQQSADLVLLVVDDSIEEEVVVSDFVPAQLSDVEICIIRNKIDLTHRDPSNENGTIRISLKEGLGLSYLREKIKETAGFRESDDSHFIARQRHLDAIQQAYTHLSQGISQLETHLAGELVAEDLLHSQQALSQITGEISSDDLLGLIFGSFCIGK